MLLGGSTRRDSCSFAALVAAGHIATDEGFETDVVTVLDLDLPVYVPYWQLTDYSAGQAQIATLVESYRHADAHVWSTPTYHGTVSGALKNALDFAELLSCDPVPYLQGQPVGFVSINDSEPFAALRLCARELRAWVAPTQVEIAEAQFSPGPVLRDEKSLGRLARMVRELKAFLD